MNSIILRDWEVRGILEGRISQLRRPVKPQPEWTPFGDITFNNGKWCLYRQTAVDDYALDKIQSPFGQIGDTIFGKETWNFFPSYNCEEECFKCITHKGQLGCFMYRATTSNLIASEFKWEPSIRMPIETSRIHLCVDEIWVERVQEIDDLDAEALGMDGADFKPGYSTGEFRKVWDSIYKKQGLGWDVNPYVFCAKVRRVEG